MKTWSLRSVEGRFERHVREDAKVLKYFVSTDGNHVASRALQDFEASLQDLRPSTRRAYLAGAKALFRAAFADLDASGCASYAELGERLRAFRPPKPVRVRPFFEY